MSDAASSQPTAPIPDPGRLHLLYRIPIGSAKPRLLEVTARGSSVLSRSKLADKLVLLDMSASRVGFSANRTAANETVVCSPPFIGELPFGDGEFDAVILHRTLDDLSTLARREGRSFLPAEFLSGVFRTLASGGIVAGCVQNRHGIENVLRDVRRLFHRPARTDEDRSSRALSIGECDTALRSAGFRDVRLFSVLPGPDNPIKLLSISSGWSPAACRRQIEELRPGFGVRGYVAWRMLAELGVSQRLSAAIFFWGRKACC